VLYVDEDGWNIVAVDDYDARDQLFQFQEGHYVPGFNVLGGTTSRKSSTTSTRAVTSSPRWQRDKPNDFTVASG